MSLEEDLLIERFLNRTLSDTEHKAFLSRLENETSLKEKVEREKQLLETLNENDWSFVKSSESSEVKSYKKIYRSDEIQSLKGKLQEINKNYQKPKGKKITKWLLYASAAVITLLVTFNVFFTSFTSQDLYNDNIEVDNLPSFISREDTNKSEVVKAQLLFENNEYEKALSIFKRELDILDKKNGALYLYIGIAQMELNKLEDAQSTFDALIRSNLIDSQKGKWYMALLYLKTEEIEKSKKLLNEISNDSLYNYDKANKLLKKIPKIKSPK